MLHMCICMHYRFVENHPIRILEDGPLFLRWFYHRNASANMFYLLKNLLLLILVIFKLKCNNLIFNEIMVLNASYVCSHAF
jgi:hypothetical protein